MSHSHEHGHGHESHAHHSRRHDQARGPHIEAVTHGSASTIAQYLDELAVALRGGGVSIRSGERAVGLRVDGDVMLELRAEAGACHDSRVSLRLSWQAPRAAPPPPTPELEISALRPGEPGAQPQPDGVDEQHSDMGQGDG
ncbi:MAG TPA: amphi-Trp domain-containing protein [Ktedonobacterales bacterium]|nr:amphi-Trp domain-containing protein [Ktedonobacterales bacterium]